jgi:tRNA U34 2-thiouridine synthase MnmA/TrmU
MRRHARLEDMVVDSDVSLPIDVTCAIRYRGELHAAHVTQEGGAYWVHFATEVAAVVTGQFAVFYLGDRVVGGGRIVASAKSVVATSHD